MLCVWQPGAADAASIPNNALDPVTADLAAGRADDAISRLNLSLTAQPADAEAHNLLCRVYYQEQRWDDAIHQCEAAVQLAPQDSQYHLWLGRAYGEKADAIHSIKAYGLAKKVHSEFERAVQLDTKMQMLSPTWASSIPRRRGLSAAARTRRREWSKNSNCLTRCRLTS